MTQNLLSHRLDPLQMPLVLQYNKRDLPQVLEVEALDRALNTRQSRRDPRRRRAWRGCPRDLRPHPGAHGAGPGQPLRDPGRQGGRARPAMGRAGARRPVRQDAARSRGRRVRARRRQARSRAPVSRRRRHRLRPVRHRWRARRPGPRAATAWCASLRRTAPEDGPRGTGAEARAGELVETYAEASAQLGAALTELREERDVARQRLDDVRETLTAAQELLSGQTLETAIGPGAGAHGAHRGRRPRRVLGASARPAAACGRARRPLRRAGTGLARRAAARDRERGARSQAGVRLRGREPRPRPGARPTRGPFRRALGGAVPHARRPAGPGRLLLRRRHRAAGAGRARAPGRDPARDLGRARAGGDAQHREGRRARARAGARRDRVARRARAPGRSIETLRDRLGEIRSRPDAPPWFADQYVRLVPVLASASLDDARSLLAFGRGEIRKDTVYLEDLLAELRTPDVTVELEPAAETVVADAALLRVALRALADEMRSRSGGNTRAARDPRRRLDRRRAPERALARRRRRRRAGLDHRGPRPRPRPSHRRASRRNARGRGGEAARSC